MNEEPISPAVKSLLVEQARQQAPGSTQLQKELEDTFPASDPPSLTQPAHVTSHAESSPAGAADNRRSGGGEPLVTSALESVRSHPSATLVFDEHAELAALRHDVARLRDIVHQVASGARSAMETEAQRQLRAVREQIAAQPFAAVACATVVGYLFGLRRS